MKRISFLLFLVCSLSSCEKDVLYNDATMVAKIDNELWTSDSAAAARTNTGGVTVVGESSFGKLKLNASSLNLGIHYLGAIDSENYANLFVKNNKAGAQNYETYVADGSADNVILQVPGTGYMAGTYETSSINGDGAGLQVEIVVNNSGYVIDVIILNEGYDYVAGERVTIVGGDGNAVLEIEILSINVGKIEITEYDGATLSGKFEFTAINDFGELKTIRNGFFYKVPIN